MGCGFSRARNGWENSQQGISEERVQRGWIRVRVVEIEKTKKYEYDDDIKMTE